MAAYFLLLLNQQRGSVRSVHVRELLDRFPAAAVIVGVTSFAYHASYTWVFQFFDFVGMYVFLGLPITINLLTAGHFNGVLKRRFVGGLSAPLAFYYGYVVFFSIVTLVCKQLDIKFQAVTFGSMLVILVQFIALARNPRLQHVQTPLLGAFVCFVLALACQILDQNGTWCNPTSVIQGHSFWHFFCSMALVYIWRIHYLVARATTVVGDDGSSD